MFPGGMAGLSGLAGGGAGGAGGGGGADGAPPSGPSSPEELLAFLEAYEAAGRPMGDVPQDLQELLANVKAAKSGKGGGGPADAEGEDIVPEAFFVVKTADVPTGRKVFINMCGSDKVAAPGAWKGGRMPDEVSSALDNLDNLSEADAETLRFPLSCSDARRDVDKKGEACTTVDCIFNLDAMKQAAAARPLKQFLVQLALNWVGHKHGLSLDPKFKLPKMKYKGAEVAAQRVRVDKKALVTEITDITDVADEAPAFALRPTKAPAPPPLSSSSSSAAGGGGGGKAAGGGGGSGAAPSALEAMAAAAGGGSAAPAPGQLPYTVEYEGRPVTHLKVAVDLPASLPAASTSGVAASVCAQELRVSIPGRQPLTIRLPLAVSAVGADVVVEGGQLRLRLPWRPLASVVAEMEANAPHAFGSLQLASQAFLELD
jgi:hypothetical protein